MTAADTRELDSTRPTWEFASAGPYWPPGLDPVLPIAFDNLDQFKPFVEAWRRSSGPTRTRPPQVIVCWYLNVALTASRPAWPSPDGRSREGDARERPAPLDRISVT
jgi:hypothetical protein